MFNLPNMLTLGCLIIGFGSLGAVLSGAPEYAFRLVVMAALLDGAAGWLTLNPKRQTALGAELDSLAGLTAFAVAPAVFAFQFGLTGLGNGAWALAMLVVLAAALRLSRGGPGAADYPGLPVPLAGVILVTAVSLKLPVWILTALILLLAGLMLSRLEYARLLKRPRLAAATGILLVLAALNLHNGVKVLLLATGLIYVIAGFWLSAWLPAGSNFLLKKRARR
jgi:CDP-diacylglycerol---serine O-phosphatidyltransferase